MHSIFSRLSPFYYSTNKNSSASMPKKVPGVVRTGSIPPKSPGIVCGCSLSFILNRPCNRSIIGSYPSLKIGPCCPRVPDRNPIMMSSLFPPATPSTPAVKVFVLKAPFGSCFNSTLSAKYRGFESKGNACKRET